jgi:hypothetical protein
MPELFQLTDAQLGRAYRRLWTKHTAGDGYQPFGYDRPTLALTKPNFLAAIDEFRAEAGCRLVISQPQEIRFGIRPI